ncbi:hypothetical protein ACLOJK_004281, partial [Asimina triloba]
TELPERTDLPLPLPVLSICCCRFSAMALIGRVLAGDGRAGKGEEKAADFFGLLLLSPVAEFREEDGIVIFCPIAV